MPPQVMGVLLCRCGWNNGVHQSRWTAASQPGYGKEHDKRSRSRWRYGHHGPEFDVDEVIMDKTANNCVREGTLFLC